MSWRRAGAVAAGAAMLVAVAATPAAAGNGELDGAFGTAGVTRSGITGDDFTVDVISGPGGTLLQLVQLVTGPLGAKQPAGAAVVRYLADGRLDTAFASNGVLRLPDTLTQPAQLVATASRLVAVGSSGHPADPSSGRAATPGDVVTVGMRPDGTADAGTAAVTTDLGAQGDDHVTAAAADGDAIVVTGSRLGSVGTVARLLPDGSLDAGFGAGGVEDLPGGEPQGTGVAVDADHRAIVSAPASGSTSLYRLTAAGLPDSTFAASGRRQLPLASRRLSVLADGRVIIAGADARQPLVDVLGVDGTTVGQVGLADGACHPLLLGSSVEIGADGVTRITAYGVTTSSSCDSHPVLARLILGADGLQPDASFGENGFLDVTAQQVHATAPAGVVTMPDRIVLGAVVAPDGDYDGALVALQTTGAAATSLHLAAPGPLTADWFRPVSFTADLARASGQPVAGRTVVLQRRDAGSDWTTVSSASTDAGGGVTVSDRVALPVTDYRVAFVGSDTLAGSVSPTVTVTARPVLTAALSTTLLKLGQTLRISGITGPPSPVSLQRYSAGSWTTIASTTPTTDGAYAFAVKPATPAIFRYRVLKPATTAAPELATGQLAVNVYRMQIPGIHYNAAGNDVTNPNGEYLTLRNTGGATVSLAGWKLDAGGAGQRFALPTYSIGAGSSVRIYTGRGTNGPGRIFLGRRYGDIWNNNGDTATLFDSKGVTAATFRY